MKRNQIVLFGGIFVVVLAALSMGYLLLIKQDFVVLYDNIREQDSAAIIAELESEGIEFELGAHGTRVLVPEEVADRARVLVAGSGVPMGGVVGFELFNESDMGLTDFAQKVNYQRALQGELARTIMMMDGVAFSRVHLSLPERTLFRANSPGPKAAVTVQIKPGGKVENEQVAGIQQLVSAAVTGLAVRDVAVLNESGELVSRLMSDAAAESEALDERSALEKYYKARASKAAGQVLPGLRFQILVTAIDLPSPVDDADEEVAPTRNFSLRMAFRTELDIASGDQEDVKKAIENSADLKPENGDILRFEVAAFEPGPAIASRDFSSSDTPTEAAPSGVLAGPVFSYWDNLAFLGSIWFWLGVLALLAIGLPVLRQRSRLSKEEQLSFAEVLGEQLSNRQESPHG